MAERQRIEINAELLGQVRAIAQLQARSESEVLEEAVIGYLSYLAGRSHYMGRPFGEDTADIGRPAEELYASGSISDPSTWTPRTASGLFALVNRWQRENGVEAPSDEEAMRLAVEEQHALRVEREARR